MNLSTKLTLHRGQREIDLLFLGAAYRRNGGLSSQEKIVATGGPHGKRPAYMGDAFFDRMVTTLDALKKLDFDVDLPGHGVPSPTRV